MIKTLLLSLSPHEAHLGFAQSINARIYRPKLNWYITKIKIFPFLGHLYPLICLVYSLFIQVNEKVILADGGSALILAYFLKLRKKGTKIVYLDSDCFFFNIKTGIGRKINSVFYKKIDGIISESELSAQETIKFIKKPIKICNPFPKNIKKTNIARDNYGLYVGRLEPDKNIKKVIEFATQCPYFDKFIIIGIGSQVGYVKRICRDNKKIIYAGYKDGPSNYYSKCKFFIHLPNFDPHPTATLEAALCGCFPIISKGTGSNYLFDDRFLVKDSNDFKEINEKIHYILNNEKYSYTLLKLATQKIPSKIKSISNFKNSFHKILLEINI